MPAKSSSSADASCRVPGARRRNGAHDDVLPAVSGRISTAGDVAFPFVPPELPAAPYTGLMSVS